MPAKEHTTKMNLRRNIAIIISFIVVLLLLISGIARWLEKKSDVPEIRGNLEGRYDEETITIGENVYTPRRGITSVLFMGIDHENDTMPVKGYRNGGQADFLLLMIVSHTEKTVLPIVIDRDTMADVEVLSILGKSVGTKKLQICLSHGFGDGNKQSCILTENAVSNLLLGIKPDAYVAIDLNGISEFNDLLGGVTVTLSEDFTAIDPAMQKGKTLTLTGTQAETFVRSRTGVGTGTNTERMERQKTYLRLALDRIRAMANSDSSYLDKIITALNGDMVTNIQQSTAAQLFYQAKDYTWMDSPDIPGEHKIGEDGFMEFYPEAVFKLFCKRDFRDEIRDSQILGAGGRSPRSSW